MRRLPLQLASALAAVLLVAPAASATLVYQRTNNDRLVVARDDGTHARVIATPRRTIRQTAVSPNGAWVAYATTRTSLRTESGPNRVFIVKTRGGKPITVIRGDAWGLIAWSPDSRYLVAGDSGDAIIIDVATGRRFSLSLTGPFDAASFSPRSFSPPSGSVAIGWFPSGDAGSVDQYTVIDVRSHSEVVGAGGDGSLPVWGRRGLAFVDADGALDLTLTPSNNDRTVLNAPADPAFLFPVAWSRDGRRLLVAESPGSGLLTATILTVRNRAETRLPLVFDAIDSLSKDGRHVLGETGNDIVTEGLSGRVVVLAHRARSASWN